jgi:predicted dehydrogenase
LHGLPRAYATAAELIADPDIDIVLNLTLPAVHAELTTMALEAGKHVYTEKPLAATYVEGKQIVDLAQDRGLFVCCAPDTFLGGCLPTCRRLIDDGSIGEVTAASAFVVSHGHEWFHPNPEFFYKPGAGPLLDIGPYYVTALVSLLGPARRCAAMSKRTFDKRTEPDKGKVIDVKGRHPRQRLDRVRQRCSHDAHRQFRRLGFRTTPSRNLRHEGYHLHEGHRSSRRS